MRYYSAFAFGRFKVCSFKKTTPYYLASVELISDEIPLEIEKLVKSDNSLTAFRGLAKIYVEMMFKPEIAVSKK